MADEPNRAPSSASLNDCEFLYHVDMSVDRQFTAQMRSTLLIGLELINEKLPEFLDRDNLKLVFCLVRTP